MAEPLSILLIGYAHGEGGIATHTHWLAQGLVDRGHHVQVLSPLPPAGKPEDDLPDRPYPIGHYFDVKDALWGFSTLAGKRFDVAVVAGTGWKAMIGVLANRRIKRRVFFEVMSGDATGRVDPRRLVHAGFHAVVTLATAVEETFCREFKWRGKRTIIQALPEPLDRVASIPARGVVAVAPGKIRAAYFGRIVPHKGIQLLVEQWSALSPYLRSIDIYGTGEQRAELEGRVAELGIGNAIRFHGRYPTGQAYADLLAEYDLVLLPTVGQEGGPLVLLEAMACGTPFVANGVGGILDFDNQDCRVTSGNIEEFIPAVADIAGAMAASRIDGTRLQRHYQENFSYQVLVDKWEKYFRFLVGGR